MKRKKIKKVGRYQLAVSRKNKSGGHDFFLISLSAFNLFKLSALFKIME